MKTIYKSGIILVISLLSNSIYSQSDGCLGVPAINSNGGCATQSYSLPSSYSGSKPSCIGGGPTRSDGWYSFVATGTTTTIDVTGVGESVAVAIYTSCGSGELTCSGPGTSVSAVTTTVIGTTYYIQIYRATGSGSVSGTICVHAPNTSTPPVPGSPNPNTSCNPEPSITDVTGADCGSPTIFNLDASGHVGGTGGGFGPPACEFALCPFACAAGADVDCDGVSDLSFSVENSIWFQWCNPYAVPTQAVLGFDEPGDGSLCNVQGAVWVGSGLNNATIECDNPQHQTFSQSSGVADGFTFTVIVPVGECAIFMIDGWNGAQCNSVSVISPCDIFAITLPITLTKFDGYHKESNTNYIYWSTSTEINNDFFTLEKSSNATDWELATTINGAGNSNSMLNYNWIDNDPYPSITYYRLKQTDFDGKFEYFQIIAINSKESGAFEISDLFPNPTTGLVNFTYKGNDDKELLIQIYNPVGVLVKEQLINNLQNNVQNTIKVANLAEGLYFIKFLQEDNQKTSKLLINH